MNTYNLFFIQDWMRWNIRGFCEICFHNDYGWFSFEVAVRFTGS